MVDLDSSWMKKPEGRVGHFGLPVPFWHRPCGRRATARRSREGFLFRRSLLEIAGKAGGVSEAVRPSVDPGGSFYSPAFPGRLSARNEARFTYNTLSVVGKDLKDGITSNREVSGKIYR